MHGRKPKRGVLTGASLRGDLLAGITLAAYLLPASVADASLANLPSEAGLYACLFSGLLFWIFCGSNHTAGRNLNGYAVHRILGEYATALDLN